jgi:hypothetical protein
LLTRTLAPARPMVDTVETIESQRETRNSMLAAAVPV